MRRLLIILSLLALAVLGAICIINLRVLSYSENRVVSVDDLSAVPRVGIVFGARVAEDGVASNTLHDRTIVAVEAYRANKIDQLLLSGGNHEPEVMKQLALDLGVPGSAIFTDSSGLRTYDSCFRANRVFGATNAVLFTQDYHQARAIYLCQSMGIDSFGVDTKRREYLGERWFWVREYLSRVAAWFDVNFRSLPDVPTEK